MAYYTGSAATANDMLSQLANSLSIEGWTIHTNEMITGGRWIAVEPANSPTIFHFRYDNGDGHGSLSYTKPEYLYLVHNDGGYDGNETWNTQPGMQPDALNGLSNDWASPINQYHFFIGDNYCHIACFDGNGYWHHASITVFSSTFSAVSQDTNSYRAIGSSHPGQSETGRNSRLYFTSSSSSQSNYTTKAYNNGQWLVSTDNSSFSFGAGHYHWNTGNSAVAGLSNGLWRATENNNTVTTPLIPAFCSYRRADDNWVTIGTVPNMRYVNIRYLEAGDTFIFGNEEWIVFPCIRKTNNETDGDTSQNQIDLIPNTHWMGYAYKK